MEQMHNKRDIDHLANLIVTRNQGVPNFVLFLGSGASCTSDVRTAREMIELWRRQLYERSKTKKKFAQWVKEQEWYKHDDEYSLLFELAYDQPSQRRVYIEECVKDAHPTWGYVYLTNLLSNNFFNVVLTTNFDDLIAEACSLYSEGLHPIVCAHDSAVSGIRVTSKRPKIIKLHGDFLYDNIKNTVRELETLEENMKRKIIQFAQEYGLVVVGYSGRDRSVMDVLEMLIKDEDYFKHGIYWCLRRGDEIGGRLQSLLRKDRVYCVEIPGFDEFMAYIHSRAGLSLPTPVANPIRVAHDRARLFINVPGSLKSNKIISQDIKKVLSGLQEVIPTHELPSTPEEIEIYESKQHRLADSLPSSLAGAVVKESGDLKGALRYWKEALKDNPNDEGVAFLVADVLTKQHQWDELKEFVIQSPINSSNKAYFLLHASDNEGAIAVADNAIEDDPSNQIARINRAIALKRLGRRKEMEKELLAIEEQEPGEHFQAGIAALRRNKADMLKFLDIALAKGLITIDDVTMFVVFEDYWEDRDLLRLLEVRRQLETGE
jgi:tetratricopeptide (TPR) repeat protein